MKKISMLVILLLLISACEKGHSSSSIHSKVKVKTGLEVLVSHDFDILKGKKVGLITNATGVDRNVVSTIDILNDAKDVELVALYAPEHGVRGDFTAGEHVEDCIDPATGVQVWSLYGPHRKPNAEMLKGVDVLVYDIQDIGARSYTYISTMGVTMESAAENNIPYVVLDRPNPLGGLKVEGNIVEDGFYSFVSHFPIPYVYGLTAGELARYLNGEKLLQNGVVCDLTVVPMEGWKREMSFKETGLPWVPSSTHVPHAYSAAYYVATGILGEMGVISEGVGYTLPFQTLAAPWIDPFELAKRMNNLNLPGVRFRPIVFKPFYGRFTGEKLNGVQIHIEEFRHVNLMYIQFRFMEIHHQMYPDKDIFAMAGNRHDMFDKVCGTNKIREIFSKNYNFSEIEPILEKDVIWFKTVSRKYLLY